MDAFKNFENAHTRDATTNAFSEVVSQLHLTDIPHDLFFEKLCSGLNESTKKLKRSTITKLQEVFAKKFTEKNFADMRKGNKTKILVVGAGPCGLRFAIEAAFLGCKVVVIEKWEKFTRNNVLKLWPFTVEDLRKIGIRCFFQNFCSGGGISHISIRRLQLCLLKIALVIGVDVHFGVTFKGLRLPKQSPENVWRAVCQPPEHLVNDYNFDVLVAATGSKHALTKYDIYSDDRFVTTIQGFERKECTGNLAIAIAANFRHSTKEDRHIKEIEGITRYHDQQRFEYLKNKSGIDLENFVYFKDETHYFVMTPKKESLVKKEVIKNGSHPKLLGKENIDHEKLLEYTRDAANHFTNNGMATKEFAKNSHNLEDVAVFNFSSKKEAVNSSRIIERNGKQLLLCLIGDSLIEPFWPQGTGIARGFLGTLDAVWMVRSLKAMKGKQPLVALAERESVYKILSAINEKDIKGDPKEFTIDPKTRYVGVNMNAKTTKDVEKYYNKLDDIDKSSRNNQNYYEDIEIDGCYLDVGEDHLDGAIMHVQNSQFVGECYNAPDGEGLDSETEEMIFRYNFGAPVRYGLGDFSGDPPDSDDDREISSESDLSDDIENIGLNEATGLTYNEPSMAESG